jgi:ATP/maltotriose-dependent transcriptional regulator MalT
MFAGDVGLARRDARAALAIAERIGDPGLLAAAIARVGQADTYAAETAVGLLERGVEIEDRSDLALEYYESPSAVLAWRQMRLGDVDRARELLQRLNARAMARGDESSRAQLLWSLAMAGWVSGRWVEARAHLDEASELSEQTHASYAPGMSGRVKGLIEVDFGRAEEARSSAETAKALDDPYSEIASAGVLGRLELASGNIEAAGTHLRSLPARLIALGINDPGLCVWEDAIEVLIVLGELDEARTYLDHFEPQAARQGSPWASAVAARCRGLLASAEGDAAGAGAAFERAIAHLEEHPNPIEEGRTLLCMGSTLRRAQQKAAARDALQRALAIFESLGAPLWADRARSELGRVSGRRPPTDELTATEEEVAALAARGLSNKSIASTLHLGVSTVEAHLSRVYRKLGVGRAELATHLPPSDDVLVTPRDEASRA